VIHHLDVTEVKCIKNTSNILRCNTTKEALSELQGLTSTQSISTAILEIYVEVYRTWNSYKKKLNKVFLL